MLVKKTGWFLVMLLMVFSCRQHKGELKKSRSRGKNKEAKVKPEKPGKDEWKLEWSEGFERLDGSLWQKRDYYKGSGTTGFNPANISTDDGHLLLTLSGEPYFDKLISGAEVYSNKEVAFGSVEIKMRVPTGKGVACSILTTSLVGAEKKPHDEVSIQFKGTETRSVFFNYFKRKEQTMNGNSYFLPFDASEGYHIYSIERSRRFIKWYIDGKLYYQSYEHIPGSSHRILFSIWSTSDQVDLKTLPVTLYVDYVKYFTRSH